MDAVSSLVVLPRSANSRWPNWSYARARNPAAVASTEVLPNRIRFWHRAMATSTGAGPK
jgi:hypothetical protein